MIGVPDGEVEDAADYLVTMMQGMGDDVERSGSDDGVVLEQRSLRVIRDLTEVPMQRLFLIVGRSFGRAPPARSGNSNGLRSDVRAALYAGCCRDARDAQFRPQCTGRQ